MKFIKLPIVFDITENVRKAKEQASLLNMEYVPDTEKGTIMVNKELIETYNRGTDPENTTLSFSSGNFLTVLLNVKLFEKILYGKD